MSRLYAVSPATMPALAKVVSLNYSKAPVVLHQVGSDDRGCFLIDVKAYGDTDRQVRQLCEMAERDIAIILPAENAKSSHVGVEGDKIEFAGHLYHIGCYVNPRYGTQYIHRFHNEWNDELTWKTSKPHAPAVYKVSAKISGYSNFGGIQQTNIGYCKLELLKD